MATVLFRLGRNCYRHKWLVIIAWALVMASMGGAAATLQKGFSENFAIPGTPSEEAVNLLLKNFPDQKNPVDDAGVTVVFAAPPGKRLADEPYMSDVNQVIQQLEDTVPGITDTLRFGNPVTVDEKLRDMVISQSTEAGLPESTARADAANVSVLSPDGRIGYTTFSLDVPTASEVTEEQREAIQKALDKGNELGVQTEAGGAAFGEPIDIKSTSEVVGLGVAFIVLIFTFGSVVAAGLPLVSAVLGVGIGSTAIVLATRFAALNNTTPVLAVMLGLAVGIDYALFILSRYRTEYRRMPRDEAAGMAVGTAGSAVVFAGLTVIIALVTLSIVRIPFLTYMGLAAAFTVLVAVMVALTLIPALLAVAGKYAFGVKIPGTGGNRLRRTVRDGAQPAPQRRSKGRAWARFIHRYPALVFTVVVLGLGALTLPAGHLQLSLPSDNLSEKGTTQRASADLMREGFGIGTSSPFLVVVDAHDVNPRAEALEPLVKAQREEAERAGEPFDAKQAAAQASFMYTVQNLSTNADVKHVQIVDASADGQAAQLLLTPRTGPHDPATTQLLGSLRAQERHIQQATGITLGITGLTPIQQDVTNKLSDAMPIYLAIVVGLAVLLLLIIFRSIMVPLVAGFGFLLSVGAAFGVTVLFWQDGLWGIVQTPGPLISFMPIFLIGVTFGLAMDYQMFLVSRMREQYVLGRKKGIAPGYNLVESSIIEGFTLGSRVVTSAALIMIAVFVAFIDQPLPFIKIFGFALGAGVLFDAFFIRMGLVPASMFLLGRATWWIPRWLERILPTLDVEGAALEAAWERKHRAQEQHDQIVVDDLIDKAHADNPTAT
ncbi:MMPL family transporter [Corynebacterium aquilae]|uniref:Multidrug RND transporter n=1 Tax=Corynebacterium aquilae DSM 44791 TaxID=1431546 RepID=A0A1L7CD90_9CORY|nr:MMPL family transporter [Corynebacterium aquilae]APT83830.1 multidrug RND transporter [Corynebacterium aquilae DSM 44791]